GVEPDEREPAVAGREPFDRADVGTATAAEDERPLGQLGCDRQVLLAERLLLDHRRLGIWQRQPRRLRHRPTAIAPGLRDPHEPGRELPSAGMALVGRPERDGGERAAVRTTGTEAG